MANRNVSSYFGEDGSVNQSWAGLLNGDSGNPAAVLTRGIGYTIQATGTFGAGGSVALHGSNDGVNYLAMDDAGGTTIAMTTTKIWRMANMPKFVKPVVTAGDGTTVLAVAMFGHTR